ncbi:MAG: HepT-like ribonuclease domain-containing protein [Acidobacteriota bacterium]
MWPDKASDRATLVDLITACSRIVSFAERATLEQLERDPQLMSALAFQIAILGEATKRLTLEIRQSNPEVQWKAIAGMRDRLIHGYDEIDLQELWQTVTHDVPTLLEQLERIQTNEV